MIDLVVAEDGDVAGAAVGAFLEAAPRVVALAGGRTPRSFYERLARIEYRWEDVDVLFTDERCVPPDHRDSNFRMANEALLSRLSPAPRVHRMPGEACDPVAHEGELRSVLGPGAPRLDLAVLGLGEDGHTASLFYGDPALDEMERLVARVDRPDHPRLTLTLPLLSAAPTAMFLVAGEPKRKALRRLVDGEDVPAARVRSRNVVVIADRAAAG